MFSLDLDAALGEGRRGIDEISVYIGNPSGMVSSGLCYQLSAAGLRFDNLYYFFDRQENWEDIVGKVASSAHLDLAGLDVSSILWPELCDCGIIVVANKKYNDGVYFLPDPHRPADLVHRKTRLSRSDPELPSREPIAARPHAL